jgi:gluconate 5-dehydrogenase
MNAFALESEVALITGGGSGLGLGIARCFAAAGAKVILVGRNGETLQAACTGIGPSSAWVAHDIARLHDAESLVAQATKLFDQPPSILVNNAGNHLKKSALATSPEEFDMIMRTHVAAGHALTSAALPEMLERGRGSILFIASMASYLGVPNVFAYSAAKTAVLGMVRALSSEVSGRGVRVNAIAPGWIESPMSRQAMSGDPQREKKILDRTFLGHFGQPEDVGWAATYLCSPAAKFVTGTTLVVDGGASIGF